jgi:hypothetical protein
VAVALPHRPPERPPSSTAALPRPQGHPGAYLADPLIASPDFTPPLITCRIRPPHDDPCRIQPPHDDPSHGERPHTPPHLSLHLPSPLAQTVTIPTESHRYRPYMCTAGRLRRSPTQASLMGRLPYITRASPYTTRVSPSCYAPVSVRGSSWSSPSPSTPRPPSPRSSAAPRAGHSPPMPLSTASRVCLHGFGHSGVCGEGRVLQGKTLALMRRGWGAEEAR